MTNLACTYVHNNQSTVPETVEPTLNDSSKSEDEGNTSITNDTHQCYGPQRQSGLLPRKTKNMNENYIISYACDNSAAKHTIRDHVATHVAEVNIMSANMNLTDYAHLYDTIHCEY